MTENSGQLTEEGQKVAQILTAVAENPKLAEEPEIKEFLGKVEEFKKTGVGQNGELTEAYRKEWLPLQEKGDVDAINALRERIKQDIIEGKNISNEFLKQMELPSAEELKKTKKETKKEEHNSVFFSKNKEEKLEFKDLKELSEFIDKKYSIKDINTFARTIDTWRNDSQKKAEIEKEKTGYDQLFEIMPEALYSAIENWSKGGNWREHLKSLSTIDFSKNFDKQDTLEILNHYFPGKYTDADVKENDDVVKKATELAKDKYEFEKNKIAEGRADIERKVSLQLENRKNSANGSIQKLIEMFPDMDKKQLDEIKKVLVGDINGLFFSNEVFKNDAAEKLAMALYGKGEIERLQKKVNELENEKEEIISKMPNKPGFRKEQQPSTVDEKALKLIKDLMPKKRY